MVEKIILCDINDRVVSAFYKQFHDLDLISIIKGNIFEQKADTIVTPGNSFAYMDGGLDQLICRYFGPLIESEVRKAIREYTGNMFLPVGEAVLVETGDKRIPYLIYAPTMERPKNIRETDNVFRAMKVILKYVKNNDSLKKVAIPGLGTGVGEMFPDEATKQMRDAFKEMYY